MPALAGYFPIMPTPYNADNSVDLTSVRRLVHYLIDSGAQGMSPNGGDSEARHLTADERMRICDTVMEANGGRTPVLVGTTADDVHEAARLTRHAEQAGAAAVFVMPAWESGDMSHDEMLARYEAICQGSDIPVMVHARPNMDVAFLEALLLRLPQVQYVKEETTFGPKLREYARVLGDRLTVFGPGLHYPAELAWGARGVMPSCCAPHSHATIFRLWEEGDPGAARQVWNRMLPLVFWRWHTAAQEAGKLYLKELGVFETCYVRPDCGTLKLDQRDRQELLAILETMGEPPY